MTNLKITFSDETVFEFDKLTAYEVTIGNKTKNYTSEEGKSIVYGIRKSKTSISFTAELTASEVNLLRSKLSNEFTYTVSYMPTHSMNTAGMFIRTSEVEIQRVSKKANIYQLSCTLEEV